MWNFSWNQRTIKRALDFSNALMSNLLRKRIGYASDLPSVLKCYKNSILNTMPPKADKPTQNRAFQNRRILWLEFYLSATAVFKKRGKALILMGFLDENVEFTPYLYLWKIGSVVKVCGSYKRYEVSIFDKLISSELG